MFYHLVSHQLLYGLFTCDLLQCRFHLLLLVALQLICLLLDGVDQYILVVVRPLIQPHSVHVAEYKVNELEELIVLLTGLAPFFTEFFQGLNNAILVLFGELLLAIFGNLPKFGPTMHLVFFGFLALLRLVCLGYNPSITLYGFLFLRPETSSLFLGPESPLYTPSSALRIFSCFFNIIL